MTVLVLLILAGGVALLFLLLVAMASSVRGQRFMGRPPGMRRVIVGDWPYIDCPRCDKPVDPETGRHAVMRSLDELIAEVGASRPPIEPCPEGRDRG